MFRKLVENVVLTWRCCQPNVFLCDLWHLLSVSASCRQTFYVEWSRCFRLKKYIYKKHCCNANQSAALQPWQWQWCPSTLQPEGRRADKWLKLIFGCRTPHSRSIVKTVCFPLCLFVCVFVDMNCLTYHHAIFIGARYGQMLRWVRTRGQSNLTKSASRGAHSPVRGHPRGSKVVPLNSWGRVSY